MEGGGRLLLTMDWTCLASEYVRGVRTCARILVSSTTGRCIFMLILRRQEFLSRGTEPEFLSPKLTNVIAEMVIS